MPPSPDPVVRAACDQVNNHPVCVPQAERARGPTEMRGTSADPPVCPRVRACRCQYPRVRKPTRVGSWAGSGLCRDPRSPQGCRDRPPTRVGDGWWTISSRHDRRHPTVGPRNTRRVQWRRPWARGTWLGMGPARPPLAGVSERARCPEGGVTAYGGQQESRPPWLSRLRDESGHRGVVWVGLLAPRAELARRARATLGCLPAVFPAPVWGKPDLGRHGGFAAPRPRRRTAATCAWCRGGLPAPTDRLSSGQRSRGLRGWKSW